MNSYGIVTKEELSKVNIIKRSDYIFDNLCFDKIGDEQNSYQYFIVSNLCTIVYNSIFPFENFNKNQFIYNLLSSYMICSIKLKKFFLNQYQDYIKLNFPDIQKENVSFNSVKNLLLFDFQNKPVYKEYIEELNEDNFESTILAMFLEETDLQKEIIKYQSLLYIDETKCFNLTTFYLCFLYVLNKIRKNEENEDNDNNNKEEEQPEFNGNINLLSNSWSKKNTLNSKENMNYPKKVFKGFKKTSNLMEEIKQEKQENNKRLISASNQGDNKANMENSPNFNFILISENKDLISENKNENSNIPQNNE